MNLASPTRVRALLAALGIRPNRSLGQNFLIDANVLRILVEAADLAPGDHVLEVGPGLGVLTEALAQRVGRLVAVEKDRRLAAYLADRFAGNPAVEILCADMLDHDVDVLGGGAINKVVANLPYRPGTRILVDLVRSAAAPARMVLTVQREVADRLLATVGGRDYGLLSVWVGRLYDCERIKQVSPTCFWPAPAVTSAIVRLVRHNRLALPRDAEASFYAITRHAFTMRRKQLATIVRHAPDGLNMTDGDCQAWLDEQGLPADARPEALSVENWCCLGVWLRAFSGPPGDEEFRLN